MAPIVEVKEDAPAVEVDITDIVTTREEIVKRDKKEARIFWLGVVIFLAVAWMVLQAVRETLADNCSFVS